MSKEALLSGAGIADIEPPLAPVISEIPWITVSVTLLLFVLVMLVIIARYRRRHSVTGMIRHMMSKLEAADDIEALAKAFYRLARDTGPYAVIRERLEEMLFSSKPCSHHDLSALMAEYLVNCKEQGHG